MGLASSVTKGLELKLIAALAGNARQAAHAVPIKTLLRRECDCTMNLLESVPENRTESEL
jgi:hypothetical protein